MPKFKRNSATVEAFQWTGWPDKPDAEKQLPKWFVDANKKEANEAGCVRILNNDTVKILTLDGILTAYKKDFIMRTPRGELYPCNPNVFNFLHSEITEE